MTEPDANNFESTLDFFILSGFRDGPRSLLEVRQRVQWAERLLQVAAAKKGRPTFSSLCTALERLQREGGVKCERSGERHPAESVYSLTEAGQHRLEQERARQHSIVSEFVEDSELDGSFQRFLDQSGPFRPD